MEYIYLYHKGKRPPNVKPRLRKELTQFVEEESKKDHFPSRREIERKFHLKLDSLFNGIADLYFCADLPYKPAPNQELKAAKADLLLRIVLDNLGKFGLTLVDYRKVHERGIDIVAEDCGKKVGIEIKAYNAGERLKGRDINQVLRFIDKENLSKAIIITSTNLKEPAIIRPKGIEIIDYNKLVSILGNRHSEKLNYIREFSVNVTNNLKNVKRQKILGYIYDAYFNFGKKPTYNDILKNLHLDLYTYFNNLFDIYKTLKIPPPTKNMNGKRAKHTDKEVVGLWKNEFKKYILEEVRKGRKYPSGEDIGNHFGISHIWNIANVSDLYTELGLKPYRERPKRKFTSPSDV